MKKRLTAFIATALLLTACGGAQEKGIKENPSHSLKVDKGIINVDVTIPANFFINSIEEEIIAKAKGNGVTETLVNKDGSVTYTLSKVKYKEMMEEMGKAVVSRVDEIVNSGEYTSIKDISYNKYFNEFNVKVNRQQYEEGFDRFAIFELVIVSTYYSAFDGKSAEDVQVILNMIDETTGEIYDTAIYPE